MGQSQPRRARAKCSDRTQGMNDAQIRDKVKRADQTGKLQQQNVQGASSLCRKIPKSALFVKHFLTSHHCNVLFSS